MENDQLQNNLFELQLDEEGRSNFSAIAQWTFMNALISLISLGITIVATFVGSSKLNTNDESAGGSFMTILISAVVTLLLNITLINASGQLKKGLALSDQGYFNNGMAKLASYFKIVGILMICFLVLFIVVMLFLLVAGSGAKFS